MMRHVLVTMVTSAKLHSVSFCGKNEKKSFNNEKYCRNYQRTNEKDI